MANFSIADIEKIADLARLQLTDAEKALFTEQFQTILSYFSKIEAVPLPERRFEERALGQAHLREDRAVPSGVSPDTFSAYLENGHFKVPSIIE